MKLNRLQPYFCVSSVFLILLGGVARASEVGKTRASTSSSITPHAAEKDEDDEDDADDTTTMTPAKNTATQADDEESEDDDSDDDAYDPVNPITGNVTLASDYVLRGISQTSHQPALQGGFDWTPPVGLYLGVWGSNVHLSDSPATVELDGYAGYLYHFSSDWSLSAGALVYTYWADSNRNSFDIPVKGQWKAFSLEVDYSPNWNGSGSQDFYFLGEWKDKVIWNFSLGFSVGYSVFTGSTNEISYPDYQISVSRKVFGLDLDLSEYFANQTFTVNNETAGSTLVFSVSKSF